MKFYVMFVLLFSGCWLGAFLHKYLEVHEESAEISRLQKENEELRRHTEWNAELLAISSKATDRCTDVLEECMGFLDINFTVKRTNPKGNRGNTEEGQGKGMGVAGKRRVEALWKDACGGGYY